MQLSQGEKKTLLFTFCLVVLIGLALLAACPAHAQEVIMNQPSADVDYASGAGTNGYTSPGVMFSKKNFFISPGYMIANPHNPNGAHQSFVMIGDTF